MVGAVSGVRTYDNYSWLSRVNPSAAGHAQSVSTQHQTALQNEPVRPVASLSGVGAQEPQLTRGELPPVREGADPAEMAVRMRMKYMDDSGTSEEVDGMEEPKSPQEVMEKGACQTCEKRKYQDGSDDPGVSFKTPSHIDSSVAASVVRGHEMEHVVREQAAAKREGREVLQQSVTLHNAICPECGEVYVSGGTTRTTTANVQESEQKRSDEQERQGVTFEAVA